MRILTAVAVLILGFVLYSTDRSKVQTGRRFLKYWHADHRRACVYVAPGYQKNCRDESHSGRYAPRAGITNIEFLGVKRGNRGVQYIYETHYLSGSSGCTALKLHDVKGKPYVVMEYLNGPSPVRCETPVELL